MEFAAQGPWRFRSRTLPNLVAAGLAAGRLRAWAARCPVRLAAGTVVLGFGVIGLPQASGLAESVRRGLSWV